MTTYVGRYMVTTFSREFSDPGLHPAFQARADIHLLSDKAPIHQIQSKRWFPSSDQAKSNVLKEGVSWANGRLLSDYDKVGIHLHEAHH